MMSDKDIDRYSRQLLLPQVGGAGQAKLKKGRALLVGLGGLGSPAALYLAAAGVGTLGLLDNDLVDATNLHRQILHFTPDVGRPKVTSAAGKLAALNPDVETRVHRVRLGADNVLALLEGYDVVLDGSDNFPTRYLVNDACVLAGKPLVSGAVLQWQGQVTTILPRKGHCYRCLFPEPPAPGATQSCSEAGVMGAVAGAVGALMAGEALKVLLGMPGILTDRLLTLDLAAGTARQVPVRRDPRCAVCGDAPTITALRSLTAPACAG